MRYAMVAAATTLWLVLTAGAAAQEAPGRWVLVRCEEWSHRRPAWPDHERRISMPEGAASTRCTYVATDPEAVFTSTHSWSRPARIYLDDQPFTCQLSSTISGRHTDPKKGAINATHHSVFFVGEGTPTINSWLDVSTGSQGPGEARTSTFDRRFHRLAGRDPKTADNMLAFVRAMGGDSNPNMATEMGVTYWYQWVPGATDAPGGEAAPGACLGYAPNPAPLDLSGDWDAGKRWTFRPTGAGSYSLDIQAEGGAEAESGTARLIGPHLVQVHYKRPSEKEDEARDYTLWLAPNRRCGAGFIRLVADQPRGQILEFRGYTVLARRPEAEQPAWARDHVPHASPVVTGTLGIANAPIIAAPPPPGDQPGMAATTAMPASGLLIQALIDGRSELHVTPTGLYWVNLAFSKPGRNNGKREPTRINGTDWQPLWGDAGDGGQDTSGPYALAVGSLELAVATYPDNRSAISVRRTEDELVIVFDDPQPNDSWYTVRLVPAPRP